MTARRVWLLALCLAAAWSGWLTWLAADHGPGTPKALSGTWEAVDAWELLQGQAADSSGPAIARLDTYGEFFAVSRGSFEAERWPLLKLRASGYPLNYVLMLAWKRTGSEQAFFTRLQVPDGGRQTYLLSRFDNWQGTITELALYGYPQPQTSPPVELPGPVVFDPVERGTDSWAGRLAALGTGWTGLDPWAMLSVSSLGRYPDLEEGVSLNATVGVAALLAVALIWLLGGLPRRARAGAVLAVVLAATAVLQLQSSRSLLAQVAETRERLAGLSPDERRRYQFDRELIDLAALAQPLIQRRDRVHVVTDDRFFNLRAAWHLRPANVSTFYLPPAEPGRIFRAGDLVFLYRQPRLQQALGGGQIRLGSQTWRVLPLMTEQAGALVRLLERNS